MLLDSILTLYRQEKTAHKQSKRQYNLVGGQMFEFAEWIDTQLKERGWRPAELARRANIDSGQLSRILNDERRAGPDTCLAIARAFGEPPENVFRAAGLLPPLAPPVQEEHEMLGIIRALSETARTVVLDMLRGLARAQGQPVSAVGEYKENYIADDTLIPELLAEFQKVPDEFKEDVIQQVQFMVRMANRPPARLVGEEDPHEEQRSQPGA